MFRIVQVPEWFSIRCCDSASFQDSKFFWLYLSALCQQKFKGQSALPAPPCNLDNHLIE